MRKIPELAEKKILDPKSAENLTVYCSDMINAENGLIQNPDSKVDSKKSLESQRKKINWVPVILMIASCVLVVGGLISLIAYNWAFISRTTKIICAILILLGIQAAVLIFKFKGKMEKASVRESLGLGWALLFGAVIAFISQTLRLPSDTSSFIALWAVSSILVLYPTKSDSVFFLTLILGIAFIASTKHYEDSSSLIYLIFAALVPYPMIQKKQSLKWILVVYAVSMLGFCLDKTLPGLWIVAYSSLLSIFAMSKIKNTSRIFSSALLVLLVLLCKDYFWENIGWQYVRSGPSHHTDGFFLDIILTCALFFSSITISAFRIFVKKEKSCRNLIAVIPLIISALYVIYSVFDVEVSSSALASSILILMGFVITASLAFLKKESWYIAPLVSIPIQFVIADFYNPLAFAFCYLLFISAIIMMRQKRFKIQDRSLTFTFCRICSLALFFLLTLYELFLGWHDRTISSIILYALVTILSMLILILSSDRKRIPAILDLLIFPILGLIISILVTSKTDHFFHWTTEIILIAMSLLGFHSLLIKNRGSMSPYIFASLILLLIPLSLNKYASFEGILLIIISVGAWFMALYGFHGNKAMGFFSVIISSAALFCTAYLKPDFDFVFFESRTSIMGIVAFITPLLMFIASGFLIFRDSVKNKRWINPVIFIHPLLIYTVLLIPPLTHGNSKNVIGSICFALLILSCVYYLVKASYFSSLAMANCAAIFLGIAVMVKFFAEDYGLIAKGLLFIALGAGVFIINIFLQKKNKEKQNEK